MEPEPTNPQSTNPPSPQPPENPAPQTTIPTDVPPAPVPASSAETQATVPATTAPTPAETKIITPDVPAPATPVADVKAPEPTAVPPVQPVPPIPTAPAAENVPPAPAAGSLRSTILVGALAVSLLAGGAAAYYYWMNMQESTTSDTQAMESATSTPQAVLAGQDIRPTLETTIAAMNSALAQGDFDAFMRVMVPPEGAPTREEFTASLKMLRDFLTVDLSKTTFLQTAQQGNTAGYYFTKSETFDGETSLILGMIRFVNDNGTWKIEKLYSKNIDSPDKAAAEISTNPSFSLSQAAEENKGSIIMLDQESTALQYTMKINGKVVENTDTKNVWGGVSGETSAAAPVNKYVTVGNNAVEITVTNPATKSSSLSIRVKMDDKTIEVFEMDTSKKTQTFTFVVPEGTKFAPHKSLFDDSFGN